MLELENACLRPIVEGDLEMVLEWRNSDRIRSVMFTDHIIKMEDHREWFKRLSSDDSALCLVFETCGRPVGVVNIVCIDRRNNRCHWGFYIGEHNAQRGAGSIMGYLAVEYVFGVLNIHKLCGEVLALNTKSIVFHKKLGFVEEGLLKRHVLKNGNYDDVVVMAIFKEDWIKIRDRLKNYT